MIALTPRPLISHAMIVPAPGDVRHLLRRAGKHESLLRTVAAAPRPVGPRREAARQGDPG